jgi:hypothetical protein
VIKGAKNAAFAQFQVSETVFFSNAVEYGVSFELFLDYCDFALCLKEEEIAHGYNSKAGWQSIGLLRD